MWKFIASSKFIVLIIAFLYAQLNCGISQAQNTRLKLLTKGNKQYLCTKITSKNVCLDCKGNMIKVGNGKLQKTSYNCNTFPNRKKSKDPDGEETDNKKTGGGFFKLFD